MPEKQTPNFDNTVNDLDSLIELIVEEGENIKTDIIELKKENQNNIRYNVNEIQSHIYDLWEENKQLKNELEEVKEKYTELEKTIIQIRYDNLVNKVQREKDNTIEKGKVKSRLNQLKRIIGKLEKELE